MTFDAQTYHAHNAFPPDARCICRRPPISRAIVMCPYDEAVKRNMVPSMAFAGPSVLSRIVYLKGGDGKPETFIRVSIVYACETCQSVFEKALAKLPSWACVDLSHGPNPTRRVVG